jgi:hypothetical protein
VRRAPWIAALALALVPVGIGSGATTASEVVTVPPQTAAGTGPSTDESLDAGTGKTFLTITGVITRRSAKTGEVIQQVDALYDFTNPGAIGCCSFISASMPGNGFGASGHDPVLIMYYGEPAGAKNPEHPDNPAYDPVNHSYRIHFTAKEKGPMTFFAYPMGRPVEGSVYEGGFTVTVEHEAAERWVVPFKVHQRGLPHRNEPDDIKLAAASTDAVGKLFLSKKPHPGGTGHIAAAVTHADDYVFKVGDQRSVTARIAPKGKGRFSSDSGRRIVSFDAVVTKVTTEGDGRSLEDLRVGQEGTIRFVDDKQGEDTVTVAFPGVNVDHSHLSRTGGKDNVRVTIGTPRRVTG